MQTHGRALTQPCLHFGGKMYPIAAHLSVAETESCCLLFQNILKRTKEGTKEEQTASKALASVAKVNALHSSPSITNPYNLTLKCFARLWKRDIIHCPREGFPIEWASLWHWVIVFCLTVFVKGMNLILTQRHSQFFYIMCEKKNNLLPHIKVFTLSFHSHRSLTSVTRRWERWDRWRSWSMSLRHWSLKSLRWNHSYNHNKSVKKGFVLFFILM